MNYSVHQWVGGQWHVACLYVARCARTRALSPRTAGNFSWMHKRARRGYGFAVRQEAFPAALLHSSISWRNDETDHARDCWALLPARCRLWAIARTGTSTAVGESSFATLDADQSGALSRDELTAYPTLTKSFDVADADTTASFRRPSSRALMPRRRKRRCSAASSLEDVW